MTFSRAKIILAILIAIVATSMDALRAEANVDLLYFRALNGSESIILEWETASELDNLGFNIYRGDVGECAEGPALNSALIPSQVGGQPTGAFYTFEDTNVSSGLAYTYWLEDVDFNGGTECHGPLSAEISAGSAIPTQPPIASTPADGNTPVPDETVAVVQPPTDEATSSSAESQEGEPSSTPIPKTPVASPTPTSSTFSNAPGTTQDLPITTAGTRSGDAPGNGTEAANDGSTEGEAVLNEFDTSAEPVVQAQTPFDLEFGVGSTSESAVQAIESVDAVAEFDAAQPLGHAAQPFTDNTGEESSSLAGSSPGPQPSVLLLIFFTLSGGVAVAGSISTWLLVNRPRP